MAWTLSPTSVQDGIPAAYLLSSLNFDEIDIAFAVPEREEDQRVIARRSEHGIVIELTGVQDVLTIPIVDRHQRARLSRVSRMRAVDDDADLVARLMQDQRDHPVLQRLSELPGPLYLPLNRRWTGEREAPYRVHTRRSTTAGHLPISEVVDLAQRAFRREQARMFARNESLRNEIITSLFEPVSFSNLPRVWTQDELNTRRDGVLKVFERLGLNDAQRLCEQSFVMVEEVVKELGGREVPGNFAADPNVQSWFKWIVEASPIAFRIERLIPLIEEYESDRTKTTRRSSAFVQSVNSFICDTGKELEFRSESDLFIKLPGGQDISSHSLSSGELQLLTLFTFLYFQFDPEQEFAVLVDEPELSLHLAWQQRYVNSVREANPNAQFIIATHSPEIAGPAEEALIDLSPNNTLGADV